MTLSELINRPAKTYSANVRLELHINDLIIPLAQVGDVKIKLKKAAKISPGPAEVRIFVDDELHSQKIQVLGPSDDRLWIPIQDIQ